jgi:hypothetical protein
VLFFAPPLVAVTLTVKEQDALAAKVAPDKLTEVDPAVALIVPAPQVPATPLGVATNIPVGNVSENATPFSDVAAFGLLKLNVNVVAPFSATDAAPNDFAIVGGAATIRLAFEVFPVPAFVEFTVTLLFFAPAVVPVTLTEIVHDEVGASTPLMRLIVEAPFAAVMVPLQVLLRLPGVATTNPAGKLSVKEIPFRVETVSALLIVKVRLVALFTGTEAAPKAIVIAGGLMTVSVAEAVLPVPASVELTLPVVLFCTPSAMPFTFTVNVQLLFAASVAPVRLILLDPATAVIVPPPQEPVNAFGVATTSPAGRTSENATPLIGLPKLGFVIVKLRLVAAFGAIVAAPKLVLMEGGKRTVTIAGTLASATA